MDETGLTKDEIQVKHVLEKYLELFTSHSDFFKFFIAQNGALEWFGRTIKGNQKIHDYLRFEVCSQYDHLFFDNAEVCEPIECKSSHMETKQFPSEKNVIDTNLNNSSFDEEKTIANEELSISSILDVSAKARRGSITPPSSAKRFKPDHDLNNSSSTLPMLNIDDYFDKKETNVKIVVPRTVQSCFETPESTQVPTATISKVHYSELKYFETIGILRSCIQPEHKSIRNSSTLNANGSWDRETKIQISYRIRLDDNDVQFALIIYTNLHPYSALSKRNLMSEFDEVATNKRLAGEGKQKSASTSKQEKRRIGRRLRLF